MEIGSVFPIAEDQTWSVYFEYEESGHISDDDKDEIDADALLDSYKKGTEESNKERPEEDHMFVDGWETPPAYDEKLKSLTALILGGAGPGGGEKSRADRRSGSAVKKVLVCHYRGFGRGVALDHR